MKALRIPLFSTILILLLGFNQKSFSNNAIYEQRKEAYIDSSLLSAAGNKIILQAYRGLPVDTTAINSILTQIPTRSTSDFIIIELIRILFLTNGEYDAKILPVLNGVPYWMNYSDTLRGYWSENHMIMWMSSDWLLHEKYNKPIDSNLRNRLVHYLEMKIKYGFYEFFSTTYAPYAFSGLINLADFSQDAQIKNLATQVTQKLLSDILLLTNDKGVFFPVAGRNYPGRYVSPYSQNIYNLIYLLTGFGEAPRGASASGPFLATSTLPVDSVINSWKAEVDMVYSIGHSLDSGFVLNSNMSATDRIVFQWSSGAYFHPDVVFETVSLLADSNLWNHVDFTLLKPFSFLPANDFPAITENLNVISKSTLICGQDVAIFKSNAVTLSSVLDFWKGKVGFQQYPCVANVGTSSVYTWSGQVTPNINNRNTNNQNIHLPYVAQQKNVSLVMYRPQATFEVFGSAFTHKDVALQWDDASFDEVVEDSMWLIGREENGYVAVRRSCIGEINSLRACPTPANGGQTWVIVVGDSLMYGSFINFQNTIQQSSFVETWTYDSLNNQSVYYAKIDLDTISIDYAWSVDSTLNTSIENVSLNEIPFTVYPNPTDNILNIDVTAFSNETIYLKAFNAVGEVVYAEKKLVAANNEISTINTSHWSQGIYMIVIENNTNRYSRKIIKTE